MLALADFAITVADARMSAEWWHEKLGFETHTIGGPRGHAVLVAPPGDRFLMHLCEGIEPVEPGNTGVAFMTDDLPAQVARMVAARVRFSETIIKDGFGGSAKFVDPDGNLFWLVGAPTEFVRRERSRRATEGRSPRSVRTSPTRRPHRRKAA